MTTALDFYLGMITQALVVDKPFFRCTFLPTAGTAPQGSVSGPGWTFSCRVRKTPPATIFFRESPFSTLPPFARCTTAAETTFTGGETGTLDKVEKVGRAAPGCNQLLTVPYSRGGSLDVNGVSGSSDCIIAVRPD